MCEMAAELDLEAMNEHASSDPLPEPVLLIMSPPPPFLPAPGEPSLPWLKWLKAFEHYLRALGEKELTDYSKLVLLRNSMGSEGERIFTTLIHNQMTYVAAVSVLTVHFSLDQSSQLHRLRFHQRSQMPGETVEEFVAALQELLRPCNVGGCKDRLILDQLIQKASSQMLRDRLQMKKEALTLEMALAIAKEVESAPMSSQLFEVSVDIGGDVEAPVQKRKRGRPRRGEEKNKTVANTLLDYHEVNVNIRRDAGAPVQKRKRGRPRRGEERNRAVAPPAKVEVPSNASQPSDLNVVSVDVGDYLAPNVQKRKRGRPKKVETASNLSQFDLHVVSVDVGDGAEVPVPKRKRGRPRRGQETPKPQVPKIKIKTLKNKDNFYYSSDKLYYIDEEGKCEVPVEPVENENAASFSGVEDGADARATEVIEEKDDSNDEDFLPPSTRRRALYCPFCINRRFENINKLNRHMRTHTKEKPFECPVCKLTFSQSYHMTRHMRNKHGAGQFVCPNCGETQESLDELIKHKRVHRSEILSCSDCNKLFSDQHELHDHFRTHRKEKGLQTENRPLQEDGVEVKTEESSDVPITSNDADSYNAGSEDAGTEDGNSDEEKSEKDDDQKTDSSNSKTKGHFCPICVDRRFRGPNKLARHMRTHTKEKPFVCPVCGLSFSQSYHMTRHVRNQHGLGQYICPKCGNSFATWLELKGHKRSHATEGLTCLACDKHFKEKSALAKHLQAHKKIESTQNLTCNDCGKEFGRMYHLKRHIITHRRASNADLYTCPDCQKDFFFPEDLNKHLEVHVKENSGMCPKCNESFDSAEELEAHMVTHQKSYPCSTCGKKFKVEYALRKHEQSHLTEQYYCSMCRKHFIKLSHYKRHLQVHDRRESKCPHCNSVFLKLTAFKYHLRTHTAERPYQCSCCIETFEHQEDLEQHCFKHRKFKRERPYSCTRCDSAFPTLVELTEHMVTHEGEQPQTCPFCGKTFLNKNKLERHLTIHTGERPHLCSVCGNGFPSAASLRLHFHIHTGEKPYKCLQCNKSFRSNSGLRLHSRQHMEEPPSYGCPECGRTYGRLTELRMHQRYHTGDKPYACSCCNKRFISKDKLNVHMRTHTGERPFSCPHCGQTFTQTGDRNRHISKYHQ